MISTTSFPRSIAGLQGIYAHNFKHSPGFARILTFHISSRLCAEGATNPEGRSDASIDKNITEKEIPAKETLTNSPPSKQNVPKRRKRFAAWLINDGKKFEIPSFSGPNYLAPNQPFPMNPMFKPVPPVSDHTREAIYTLYTQNSVAYSTRQLSDTYGLSIKRIEAILKLKSQEKKLIAQGYTMQTHFTKNMEKMMGTRGQLLSEPASEFSMTAGKPIFKTVDEDIPVNEQDVTKWMNRKPWNEVQEKIKDRESKFGLDEEVIKIPAPLTNPLNENVKSKRGYKFVFADMSKAALQIRHKGVVREPNGEIRKAIVSEMKRNRNRRTPN